MACGGIRRVRDATRRNRVDNTSVLGKDRYMISVPSSVRRVTNNRFRGERVRNRRIGEFVTSPDAAQSGSDRIVVERRNWYSRE